MPDRRMCCHRLLHDVTFCALRSLMAALLVNLVVAADSCGCGAGFNESRAHQSRNRVRDIAASLARNRTLACSLDQSNSVHEHLHVGVSAAVNLDANYVSRHLKHTLRLLNPRSVIVVHLSQMSKYDFSKELSWLKDHPRVRINPLRVLVNRGAGSGIMFAHLLNIKWLLRDGDVPPYVILMSGNMWLMRRGVESYVHCLQSSVRFTAPTPWCTPDLSCPVPSVTAAMPRSNNNIAWSKFNRVVEVKCRTTEYRDSQFFSLIGKRFIQRCRHEGQFHPTPLWARLIDLIEKEFNLTEGAALARHIHGGLAYSERRNERLEEFVPSSFAASEQPELHMDRALLSEPPSMADRCFTSVTQSCQLVNAFLKDVGPLGMDIQLFLKNSTYGGGKLALDVAEGRVHGVFAVKLTCFERCDWSRIAQRLIELSAIGRNLPQR